MSSFYLDAKNGDDTNNGNSWATAWRTLHKALNTVSANIYVASGIYSLTDSDSSNRTLRLIGAGHVLIVKSDYRIATIGGREFYNIHFDEGTIGTTNLYNVKFYDCGLSTGAILVDGANTDHYYTSFMFCNFENPTAFDFTNTSLTTIPSGPFGFTSGSGIKLRSGYHSDDVANVNGGTKTPLGFITNNVSEGAIVGAPRKIQADSLGSSFVDSDVSSATQNATIKRINTNDQVRYQKFNLWKTDPATSANGTIIYVEDDHMRLQAGDNVGALSPVFFYDRGISLRHITLEGLEFSWLNEFQGMDSTPLTTTRTMEFRFSNTEFFQTDDTVPWVSYDRDTDLVEGAAEGKYFQMRVTFNLQAAT